MPLTASAILSRAARLIVDETGVRWAQQELLDYLNDCRREMCVARPDLYATPINHQLAAGSRQSLPADGTRLIDIVRNVASGKAIRPTEREILDAESPSWHAAAQSATVASYLYDERFPRVFYVYPPAVAGTEVEMIYAQSPADIAIGAINSAIPAAEDLYSGAMVDYVCYRAFAKDAEVSGNGERALFHYRQYSNVVGGGSIPTMRVSPNINRRGGKPLPTERTKGRSK
jgi:hypothetical protein